MVQSIGNLSNVYYHYCTGVVLFRTIARSFAQGGIYGVLPHASSEPLRLRVCQPNFLHLEIQSKQTIPILIRHVIAY